MKIISKRSGISQSLDLFIIVGAVLAVGGVVTSSVYGLVNGNSQSTAIQITSISATGAAATASTGVSAFSVTVKNIGSSAISGSLVVTLSGTSGKAGATAASPTAVATTGSSTGSFVVGALTTSPVTLTGTVTLQPGGQLAVSVGLIGLTGGSTGTGALTTGWNTGVIQSVSITFGVASAAATVAS